MKEKEYPINVKQKFSIIQEGIFLLKNNNY